MRPWPAIFALLTTALQTALPIAAQPVDTLVAVRLPHPKLEDPRAIALDPFGSIFVVDAGRDVVLKLAPRGFFEATLGGPGSRDGELDEPADIDPTNGMVVLVADAGNRRIQRFSRALTYLGSIHLSFADERRSADAARATYRRREAEMGDLSSGTPSAVASTSANELFVIDADRKVVLKLSEDRSIVRIIGGLDSGGGRLVDPTRLTTGGDLLYVTDRDAVRIYDLFGTYVRTISSPGVRSVAVHEGILYAAGAGVLRSYGSSGLERTAVVELEDDIRDIAAGDGRLLVLAGRGIYEINPHPPTYPDAARENR